MKLRIKGNSLRLRVSQSELARLQAGHEVEEMVRFGPANDAHLRYSLRGKSPSDEALMVLYENQHVAVVLSEDAVRTWAQDDQVGVYVSVKVSPEEHLDVIVEKDFACLDGSDQDNNDAFPNPQSGLTC